MPENWPHVRTVQRYLEDAAPKRTRSDKGVSKTVTNSKYGHKGVSKTVTADRHRFHAIYAGSLGRLANRFLKTLGLMTCSRPHQILKIL